jgi:hypothetical protein
MCSRSFGSILKVSSGETVMSREFFGSDAVEFETSGLASEIQRQVLGFELELLSWKLPDELEETLRRNGQGAFALHVGRRFRRDCEVEIRGRHLDRSVQSLDQDVGQNGKGRPAWNGARNEL